MRLRSLVAIAALVWIPSAQGHSMVWFDASPISGYPPIGDEPGQRLVLYCSASHNPCMWQVSVMATLGAGGITGWSLDLRTAPNNGVSIMNPQLVPGPFNNATSTGIVGSGPSLLHGAHGQTFQPVTPQTLALMTFTLRWDMLQGGFHYVDGISGGPSSDGSVVWGNDTTGDYEVVQFGPNPPAPGFEGNYGIMPLIEVHEVPEPGSLLLLSLGAAVCLSRRREYLIIGGG